MLYRDQHHHASEAAEQLLTPISRWNADDGSSGMECLHFREAGWACREIQPIVNSQAPRGAALLAYREARLRGLLDAFFQGVTICLRNFFRELIMKSEAPKLLLDLPNSTAKTKYLVLQGLDEAVPTVAALPAPYVIVRRQFVGFHVDRF
jgi:hypothetical protein